MDIKSLYNKTLTRYPSRTERTEDAATRPAKARDARFGGEGDSLELSHEARLHTAARSAAMQADDMRRERVDVLKAQVADGTYRIDNGKIAVKLLQEEAAFFRQV